MKRWLLLLIAVLLPLPSLASFYGRNLSNPNYDWSYFEMEKLQCEVEVMGLLYQTTITYKIIPTPTTWESPRAGTYEIIWDFTLIEDAAVTDCWLQPATSSEFIQVDIMDLDTAEKNYQKLPYTTPRLLLRHRYERQWNGALYKRFQMQFTPVTLTQSPVIKIRYISPCLPYYNVRRILIPLDEFWVYERCEPVILIWDHDNPRIPPHAISGGNGSLAWTRSGDFWKTTFDYYYYERLLISCAPESPDRSYLRMVRGAEANFYQLSLLPPLGKEDRKNKNILLAVDLTPWNVERGPAIDAFEKAVLLSATEKDSITLLYSAFTPAVYDSEFVPATPFQISSIFRKLKDQPSPSLNTLPHLLRQCVNIFNIHKRSGELWLLSNANTHCNPPQTALDIISQTLEKAEHSIKFKIINADLSGYPNQWINQQNYVGDDYLFENLARLSWGSFVKLREAGYAYNYLDAMLDCFAPTTTSTEVAADPVGGLTYSRFQLNGGRVNFPITRPYYEIGLFDGEAPFQANYYGLYDGDLFAKTVAIPRREDDPGWGILRTFWFDRYVQNLLLEPQSFETIEYIEKVSVDERLLTPYSGFILPGPGAQAAFTRLTEGSPTLVQPLETDLEEIPGRFELGAFPNPFNSSTVITMPLGGYTGRVSIRIVNCLGQVISDESITVDDPSASLHFRWDGLDSNRMPAASGVYIVLVRAGDILKHVKITLLR